MQPPSQKIPRGGPLRDRPLRCGDKALGELPRSRAQVCQRLSNAAAYRPGIQLDLPARKLNPISARRAATDAICRLSSLDSDFIWSTRAAASACFCSQSSASKPNPLKRLNFDNSSKTISKNAKPHADVAAAERSVDANPAPTPKRTMPQTAMIHGMARSIGVVGPFPMPARPPCSRRKFRAEPAAAGCGPWHAPTAAHTMPAPGRPPRTALTGSI